jgi:hypothetical protein
VPSVNPYPRLVVQDIALAKAANSPTQQNVYLGKAKKNILLAAQNGTGPQKIRAYRAELRATTDLLHHITRIDSPAVLSNFGRFPNALPTEIAVSPGLVFVLDVGRHGLFSISPNATANPTQVVQTGESLDGFQVGKLQYIATADTTVLALDDQHNLIRSTSGASSETNLPQLTTQKVVDMAASAPDVYLLDKANAQVWRYPNAVTGVQPPQAAYFDRPAKPKLDNAVSMALDGTDLFVLRSDGSILKFDYQENPQKFAMTLRQPLNHPLAIYTKKGLKYLWVADPANHRILQLDKSGVYVRTYTGSALSQVKSFAVGPAGNTMYVLSAAQIYEFPVTP